MTAIPLKSPGDSIDFQMTWEGLGDASLASVTHTVPVGITKVSESTDAPNGTSLVRLSGAVHGQLLNIVGTATLDTGRTLERSFQLRIMAGIG